jgi:short-subunit dehydrogenase
MIRQRGGHIIFMASMAGYVATPTYAIYAASKFGLRGFAEALRREVSIWGIHVSGVYTGAVDTSFAQEDVQRRRTGMTSPEWMVLAPETVAQAVFGLLRKPRRSLVLPGYMRLVILLNRVWPGLLDALTRRMFVEKERSEELR